LAPYVLVFATGVATALGLVSCGSSDSDNLLPGNNASEIVANLDQVKELSAEGNCSEAEAAVAEVRRQVAALPSSVDPRLRRALARGTAKLQAVTSTCVEATTEAPVETLTVPTEETTSESKPTTKETTKSTPTTTQTEPTTTTTAPTTTTTAPTTPTTPTAPTTGGGSGGVGPGKQKKPKKAKKPNKAKREG
jgi:hypothetical protein